MQHLQEHLPGCTFLSTAETGVNPDAKEAVLFALLANECVCSDVSAVEIKSPGKDKTSVYMAGQTKDVINEQLSEVVATTTYMPWGNGANFFLNGPKREKNSKVTRITPLPTNI